MPPGRVLPLSVLSAQNGTTLVRQANGVTVKTPAVAWCYAASCPLPASSGPVTITTQLSVGESSIGLGVLQPDGSTFIDEAILQPEAEMREIALDLASCPECASLQIRTAGDPRSASVTLRQIEIKALDDSELVEIDRTLFAFYDIDRQPISYDFLWFLAAAEAAMKTAGLERIHLLIIRERQNGTNAVSSAYSEIIDTASRKWRLENVVLPAIGLFPAVAGYSLLGSRREALLWLKDARHVYPERTKVSSYPLGAVYKDAIQGRIRFPDADCGPRASLQGLRYVDTWLQRICGARRPVVMTLRQYEWLPRRNNDLAAWSTFAGYCQDKGFAPVFVPDTDRSLEGAPAELAGFALFAEAAWNLGLRTAIYQRAFVNMFPSTGPSTLCMLSSTSPYLLFKILIPDYAEADARLLEERGVAVHKQLPFARPNQRITWRDDSFADLTEEFDRFCSVFGG